MAAKGKPAKRKKAKAAKPKKGAKRSRRMTGPRAVRLLTKAARKAWRASVSPGGWPRQKPLCASAAKAVAIGEQHAQASYGFELKAKTAKRRAEADSLLSKADLLYREVCKVPSGVPASVVDTPVPPPPSRADLVSQAMAVRPGPRPQSRAELVSRALTVRGVRAGRFGRHGSRHGKSRLHRR